MAGNVSSVQREFDYDFMGFTYNGVHSIRDLKIYRVSNGSRYDFPLAPTITDKSMEIPGNDGMYYFNSFHKQRQFTINIAFRDLTETNLRRLRQLFNGKEVGELIFDETPYKVYAAKITGTPTIKAICFDETKSGGGLERIYRGEGTLQFTCYQPYACTPDWVWVKNGSTFTKNGKCKYDSNYINGTAIDGRLLSQYGSAYQTKNEWSNASGLFGSTNEQGDVRNAPANSAAYVINYGDVPAPFIDKLGSISANTTLRVGEYEIKVLEGCTNFEWDSRTGMVSGEVNITGSSTKVRRPIDYSGTSCGAIPATGTQITLSGLKASQVQYKFWYY